MLFIEKIEIMSAHGTCTTHVSQPSLARHNSTTFFGSSPQSSHTKYSSQLSCTQLLANCSNHLIHLTLVTLIKSDSQYLRSISSLLTLSVKLPSVIICIIFLPQLLIVVSRFCPRSELSEAYRTDERAHESYTVTLYLRERLGV